MPNEPPEFQPRPGSEERRRMMSEPNSMIPAANHICPRCGGPVPTAEHVGQYPGAYSRTDNRTEVCSQCGQMETFEQMAGRLTPQEQWPVVNPSDPRPIPPVGWSETWNEGRASNRAARTPIPTPREVPDLRLHLLEKWIPGGIFERAAKARQLIGSRMDFGPWERHALKNASLWWIKDEMVQLTMAAAKSIPPDIRGEELVLPDNKEYGFAVLGQPYVGKDADDDSGHEIKVNAILWGKQEIQGVPALSISKYEYFDLEGGLSPSELQNAVSTGAFMDAEGELVGNKSGQTSYHLRGGAWTFLGRTDWLLPDTLDGMELQEAGFPKMYWTPERHDSMAEDMRFFTALATLVNHKLSQTDMVWTDRQVRRRAERAGVHEKREPSHVRLIRLREIRSQREPNGEDHEKRHVEWTHRWIVNGHMAWRACGPERAQRRLVFVTPHIKGPKDLPLVVKEDVRVWTR